MAGVYIHIPFCKSKCPYCDFYPYPCNENEKTEYINALIDEITDRLGEPDAGGTAWTDSTGTLTLEIFKVSNAVTIAITM